MGFDAWLVELKPLLNVEVDSAPGTIYKSTDTLSAKHDHHPQGLLSFLPFQLHDTDKMTQTQYILKKPLVTTVENAEVLGVTKVGETFSTMADMMKQLKESLRKEVKETMEKREKEVKETMEKREKEVKETMEKREKEVKETMEKMERRLKRVNEMGAKMQGEMGALRGDLDKEVGQRRTLEEAWQEEVLLSIETFLSLARVSGGEFLCKWYNEKTGGDASLASCSHRYALHQMGEGLYINNALSEYYASSLSDNAIVSRNTTAHPHEDPYRFTQHLIHYQTSLSRLQNFGDWSVLGQQVERLESFHNEILRLFDTIAWVTPKKTDWVEYGGKGDLWDKLDREKKLLEEKQQKRRRPKLEE